LNVIFWLRAWPLAWLGLLLGFVDSSDVYVTCLKCGYRWKAGERHKEQRDEFGPDEEDALETWHKRLY